MASKQMTERLSHHVPSDEQIIAMTRLRQETIKFCTLVEDLVPPGNQLDAALHNLEEVLMWGTKGIVISRSSTCFS